MATPKNPKGLAPTTYEWESSDSYAAFTHGVRTSSGRNLNIKLVVNNILCGVYTIITLD
jgi:hypothetical protein